MNVADKPVTNDRNNSLDESLVSENLLLQKLLFAAMFSRCLDVSPVVRSKCLNTVANFILSNQSHNKKIVDEIFNTPNAGSSRTEEKDLFDFEAFFAQTEAKLSLPADPLPSGSVVIRYLEKLVLDEKVFPRKSALHLLANICLINGAYITDKRIKVFVNACKDHSILVRKLLAKCLTDFLLKYPSRKDIADAWVLGVISLAADNDIKIQEKVIEYVGNIILDNLVDISKTSAPETMLPWIVLSEISNSGKRSLFRFICRSWSLEGTIPKQKLNAIQSHIGSENNFATWFLIVCLSEFQNVPFAEEIYKYYFDNIHSAENVEEYLSQLVIEALYLNWRVLKPHLQNELYSRLQNSVENFLVPVPMISRSIDICFQFNKDETEEWCRKLVELCEEHLRKRIAVGSTKHINEEILCRYLYALGDATHYSPGVSTDIINSLANLVAPDFIKDADIYKWEGHVSGRSRAIALVTLGKICLQDHFLAKTYTPVLASLLNDPSSPEPVKINSMIALTDLCVRFTSVVENYLGDMCTSLKDSSIKVRKNTVLLLTSLIQEDYLKVRSPMIYILMVILDPSNEIKELAESLIANRIISKFPKTMVKHFIQAIFFYNDYETNSDLLMGGEATEKSLYSLAGATNFEARTKIYKFMIQHMLDDHRLKISTRMCFDILDCEEELH